MDEPLPGQPAIARWILCICGFRQDRTGPTGMEKTWLALRAAYERPANGCRVSLHNWNDPWTEVAAQILRLGPDDRRQLDICIVAYSWGMGHGAIQLCRHLRTLGVRVRVIVSIDGVYHSAWGLWRALWSPLLGRPVLTVPDNVDTVYYFRQRTNIPSGHDLRAEDPYVTQLVDLGIIDLPHERIDDAPGVRDLAIGVCRPSEHCSRGAA